MEGIADISTDARLSFTTFYSCQFDFLMNNKAPALLSERQAPSFPLPVHLPQFSDINSAHAIQIITNHQERECELSLLIQQTSETSLNTSLF